MSRFNSFGFWCQKILPLVYDQSLSYYEQLCKIFEGLELLAADMAGFQDQVDKIGIRQDEVEEAFEGLNQWVTNEINKMWELLDKIKNGEYLDLYWESIKNYIDQNLKIFVAGIVKYIGFGISDDGHFIANIPETWDFLEFETIPWDEALAGHLSIRW